MSQNNTALMDRAYDVSEPLSGIFLGGALLIAGSACLAIFGGYAALLCWAVGDWIGVL